MTQDFRADPMASREGEGRAKAAWEAVKGNSKYSKIQRLPLIGNLALRQIEELLGFWLLWHLHGGFDGLERFGFNRATVFRKVARFRTVFGMHPDVFEMPGIEVDVAAYWAGAAEAAGRMNRARDEYLRAQKESRRRN